MAIIVKNKTIFRELPRYICLAYKSVAYEYYVRCFFFNQSAQKWFYKFKKANITTTKKKFTGDICSVTDFFFLGSKSTQAKA